MEQSPPLLPYDILETIFAFAAGPIVCLVASWVRTIALREMLHTVVLDSYEQHTRFLEKHRLGGPPACYGSSPPATVPLGHHVRRLLVDSSGGDMFELYTHCPRLDSLAIPASRLIAFSTSPALFPRLRRLDILTAGPSSLSSAAGLSHLALPASPACHPQDFDALVQRCPVLVMLVLTCSEGISLSDFRAHDRRMYICLRATVDNTHTDWLHDVEGPGLTVWEEAAAQSLQHWVYCSCARRERKSRKV
ncbi:hypothetical protein FB45DRAFT_928305 [Roridomyces roridus]|uniref:F-box domain-containing protein n=1 Tax=Roridomyces roridus TaxID=1738132 RepID=A0AAD7FFI4_9AGAR|nr:hypothetical protein FB45DRAFT_928305 [Roridomyces roridus]